MLNIPETNSVPVCVEGLQILLIVDPLFATCTHRETSSCCKKKTKQKTAPHPVRKWDKVYVLHKANPFGGARQEQQM